MKKQIVTLLVVGLGAVAFAASAEDSTPNAEWTMQNCVDSAGKSTTKITSGVKCELKNTKKKDCLIRDGHTGQVDWDFADCEKHPKSVLFQKEGGGDIKCGDTVAIQMGWGGENHTEWFRKCVNPQTIGINICSDEDKQASKKHYDWQLKCTGDLAAGKEFALYNVSQKDSVVYAKRPSKMVDTCWAGKMKSIPGVGRECASARDN